jgi:hypothetical protein
MFTPSSQPIKKILKKGFLIWGLALNITCYGTFSFSYILKEERNDSRILQASFLVLVSNKNNSKAIPKSSSVKLILGCGFVNSSLHFYHMVTANYTASNNTNGY